MKTLFLSIFIITGYAANAQSLNLRYTDDIYFGASKENLINAVIKKAKDLYINDEGSIIKKMQKEKKIKLSKMESRIGFLDKMETDIRQKLNAADTWGDAETISIYNNYLISVTKLLAKDLFFTGIGKPNTGHNGDGFVTLMFSRMGLSGFSASMTTIKDHNIDNGHPYTDFTLSEMSKVITAGLGTYKHERRISSWNMCSWDKPEPVYYERFNLDDGEIAGYIEGEFGAYIYQIDKNHCRYRGNQLTSILMYFYSKN